MRSREERDVERAKHRPHVHSAELGEFCRFCDSIVEGDWCETCQSAATANSWKCSTILALDDADAMSQELTIAKRILRLIFTSNRDQNSPTSISDVGIELKCYIKAFNFAHGDFQWFRSFFGGN